MKTAIVYDRVNKWGGAEQVLLTLHEMFPDAPLYTSVYNKETAQWAEVFPHVYTSFLQKIPYAKKNHEYLALFTPLAFESFNFDEYDLVISVTSESAKGIITKPPTLHVCYCLTPTRYLWSGYHEYFKKAYLKGVTKPIINYLRKWDKVAAQRPDSIIAISSEVQNRIKKYYDRESEIIYPPVDIKKFKIRKSKSEKSTKLQISNTKQEEYYLIVSRLVSYKKVDIAIEAFNKLDKKLVIVGIGREEKKLKSIAKRNIEFRGFVDSVELENIYLNAKAFIFPQVEDFGITAVEALSAGVPVIAYDKGGSIDIVRDEETGVFFDDHHPDSIIQAVLKCEKLIFKKKLIQKRAIKFSKQNFKNFFIKFLDNTKK